MIPTIGPNGWTFVRVDQDEASLRINSGGYSVTKEFDPLSIAFASLKQWCEDNDLVPFMTMRGEVSTTLTFEDSTVTFYRRIARDVTVITKERDETLGGGINVYDRNPMPFEAITCSCGQENPRLRSFCLNPECNAILFCSNCATETSAYFDPVAGLTFCLHCGIECESCNRIHSGRFGAECSECDPRFECYQCGMYRPGSPIVRDGVNVCEHCDEYFCDECNLYVHPDDRDMPLFSENDRNICANCKMKDPENKETFDNDAELTAAKLRLPTIPGRESIRLCGIEIEGGNGSSGRAGNILAGLLYEAGLSDYSSQQGYHHGSGFARVETDATVDWEVIIGPINMANTDDVRMLNKSIKIVRSAIKSGHASLDLRAGTHIHVSAERVAQLNAWNLHTIYLYLEDLLYRLGAAKWPVHRSLLRVGDDHYKTNPKVESVTKFARTFHGDRYYGLSFNNYFEKMMSGCHCGAAKYGVFNECVCDLEKCTFEFRLFNSTANTIKLHAYLALCQSLVAKAISMEHIKDDSMFPEMPFVQEKFNEMQDAEKNTLIEQWKPRLEYVANQLPLTDDEKKSIHYCVVNSDIKVLEDFSANLFLAEGSN